MTLRTNFPLRGSLILHPFNRAFNLLGRIPSSLLFAIYFLSIPFFALLYSLAFPNSFRHSTLAYEPAAREERRQLAEDIRLDLINQNNAANNLIAKWEDKVIWMNTISLNLDDATVDDEEMYFSISCVYYQAGSGSTAKINTVNRAMFHLAMPIKPEAEDEEFAYRKVRIVNSGESPVPYYILFRHSFQGMPFARLESYWGISKWQSHQIERQAIYIRGLTGSFDDFLTMLYFSAVTITTLGFGDIVPVTGMSRFTVGIEATWGIFVVGLFLNSLAYEFRTNKGSN